ncbi:GntR family transcriptional regulator [Paenibacillus sacheonensis]|uniref:GntR family transcriptional regulator n=1 Tax=Paenibacillus sacheonensis TaxID=742054 RepID=A0A7X5C4D7_9BACL|nr:GntR family transcriptional regulator [Paenibacillus sacheonensis]MBM7568008.1 GntR family transcriptional regulator [Paenibacillus sacheonensis]NBC73215.1 GntR family transcriptional regulator [Paenibacillus sacheonensis]
MFIELDVQGDVPLHEQIAQQIIAGIASGTLKPGKTLPSAKRLAADLRIKSTTVHKAYRSLFDEGFLVERYDGRLGMLVPPTEEMPRLTERFMERMQNQLRALAVEGRARGMTETEFSKACVKIYRSDLSRMGDSLE